MAVVDISNLSNYNHGPLDSVKGLVWHHTGGRGTPQSVVNTLNQRGLGTQYVMDRDGTIYQTLPTGARGAHILDSPGTGLNNGNAVGVEVIANDDSDVTPAQIASAKQFSTSFAQANPGAMIYGHGEVNPGHKQATEGLTIANAVRGPDHQISPDLASTTPGTPGASVTPAAGDNRQLIFNTLVNQVGLTPQQALGALYSLGGESTYRLSSTAVGPKGDFGIAQWMGPRRDALNAYAASYGKPATDPQIQAQFLAGELLGNDPNIPVQHGVLAALKAAPTAEDAARIWTAKMEVPKVDNSNERIAAGAHVGSLDAQGNLVLGDAGGTTPSTARTTPSTTTPAQPAVGGGQTPGYPYVPMTPEQRFDASMGQILANLGTSGGGVSGGGEGVMDAPDQPAIRMPALDTQVTQTPSPVPAQFAGGVQPGGGLGSQLSALTAPLPDPEASLTQGAPSMTSLLGTVGTPDTYNMMDPRRTLTPPLTMRSPRLA